jgi:group I intron endonuclease
MKIIINQDCQIDKCGVYLIRNIVSDRVYVGSTTMTLLKRTQHHVSLLRANNHKNTYLQNSYNKHGESNFEIIIVENTEKSKTLEREQYYIDLYKNNQYNINPLASGTPNMSRETIVKRSETMKRKYASGEMLPTFPKGHIPWNKGKKSGEIDYSYLKGIKKTISEKNRQVWIKQGEERRKNSSKVYVYDNDYNFITSFRCSKDLEEWSLTEHNNLPIGGRFKSGRKGKPFKYLSSKHITQSCKTGKPYKGLIFNNQPLHKEIYVEKLGKIGEGCDS